MGSCVEGAIPLAVVGLNHRTNSFVMCGSSALGHGGTSATAMRCWHFAAPSITVPSIGYLNAIDSDFERRKNHRMLLMPIIALTAYVMPDDEAQCLAAGMDAYVAKPIRPPDLLAALQR